IGRDLIYGADGKQVGQAVAEATIPLLDRVEKLSAEKAEVVRQLEALRKGPQTPGSEQAIAEAIYATDREAEAGQPRAVEALALLIAEAIPLFEAEAAEKKAASRP